MIVKGYKTTYVQVELNRTDLDSLMKGDPLYRHSMAFGEEEVLVKLYLLPEWTNEEKKQEFV